MLRSLKKWLPVLLVLGLSRDSFNRDVIVSVGEKVTLRCPSDFDSEIHWYKEGDLIHQISPRICVIKQTLKLNYVEPGDSGNYSCSFNNEHSVEWRNVTIYVKDGQNDGYDNESGELDIMLGAFRPDEETNEVEVGSPKLPEMRSLHLDSNLRSDKAENGYAGDHNKTARASPPMFKNEMHSLIFKPVGHMLRLRCPSIGNPRPNISWLKNNEELKQAVGPIMISKWTLTVKDLIAKDRGDYTCIVCNYLACINHTFKVDVIERFPYRPYIEVGFPRNVTAVVHSTVTFSCPIESDLELYVQWVKAANYPDSEEGSPNGTLLEAGSLEYAERLILDNVTKKDEGWYTCIAQNTMGESFSSAYLAVNDTKPVPKLEGLENFYLPKQKVEIHCNILGLSVLKVSWTFLKAPNYPSLKGSEIVKLTNDSVFVQTSMFHSVVTFVIELPGYLTCTACNTFACSSATDVILVSDVPGGFGIMEMDKQLTKGDDVGITCAASRYNYTRVEWSTDMNNGIVETDRIWITKSSTNFTHRSTLHIKNIEESDNGSYYVCSATYPLDVHSDCIDYQFLIHDSIAPFILETNMNKTVISLYLKTDGHKSKVLKCHVRGIPKPNVTWYKDDTTISANEQYEFRYDNQELNIKYFLEENSGTYTCKVENRFGKDENYQIISIKVKEVFKVLIISIVVLVLICVIFVIYFSVTLRRDKVMRKQLMEAGLTHFEEGAVQCLNPNLTVDDQAELLPYDKRWEFPRERLKLGRELGSGAFGVVAKAHALGICKDEAVSIVAVKMVRKSTACTYIRALASELKIMVHLGKHLNVVNFLGACTKNIIKRELLVIVEYCRFGNMHDYLLRHRTDFINQIDAATRKLDPLIGLDALTKITSVGSNSLSANSSNSNRGAELVSCTASTDSQGISISQNNCVLSNNSTQPGWRPTSKGDHKNQNLKPICTQDLLSWAFQVARGMEYLSQRKVLHGDLASRNILLAENNIVKISDFGLARTMYKDDNYKKQGGVPLPVKWMAIESIRDRIFSTQSDIWSFGIVLWEFFTLANTPYPTMGPERQYERLIEGYRMEQPEYATDEVYNIMLQCWKANPTLRPRFTYLVLSIGDLLEECVKDYYVDLNNPYMDMNTTVIESGKNDYLTMMSAPDYDAFVSSNNDYVNSPSISPAISHDDSYIAMSPSKHSDDLGIFRPRITSVCDKIHFPTSNGKSNVHSDSDTKDVELSPMLNHEDDNYQETNKRSRATTGSGLTETSHQILR